MDPDASVPVPARQHVDPPLMGPVRLSHLARFTPTFVLCYMLLGAHLPALPAVAISIGIGVLAVVLRIHHVPLDRWLRNSIMGLLHPRTYSSKTPTPRKARASRDFLRITGIDHGAIQAPTGLALVSTAYIVQVVPPNYAMMNADEKRTSLAALGEILTGTQHHIQILSTMQPFDATPYARTFSKPLAQHKTRRNQHLAVSHLAWLEAFTRKRRILDRSFYVVVSATQARRGKKPELEDLETAAHGVASAFGNMGAEATVLDTAAAAELLQDMVNPKSFAASTKLPWALAGKQIGQRALQVRVPDARIEANHLRLGQDHVRTLTIRQYPEALPVAWLDELLALRERVDVSIHIEAKDDWLVRRRLRTALIDLKGRIAKRSRAGYDTTEDEQQAADLEEQLELVTARRTRYFEVMVYLALHATSKDDLDRLTRVVAGKLRNLGIETFLENHTQREAYEAVLPLGLNPLRRYSQTMDTPCATALYPFLTSTTRHLSGNLVGFHAQTGAPFLVDAWRFPNHNRIVAGTSGSGKSYSVKLDMIRTLLHKPRTWIYCIDPLREFGPTTQALGGHVVYVGHSILNPFDLGPQAERQGENPVENPFHRKLSFLSTFFQLLLPDLDAYESSILHLSIQEMYLASRIGEDPASHSRPAPTFRTLLAFLDAVASMPADPRRAQTSRNLVTYLTPLLAGPLRSMDGATNVVLNGNLVTFDLKGLDGLDLKWFRLYMFTVLDYVQSRFFNDAKDPKLLVVDEAWRLMDNEGTAQALNHMSRHLRHYRAGMTLVTQTPQSFLQNTHGQAILSNCLQTYLFRQQRVSEEVAEAYGLDESDADLLMQLQAGMRMGHSECLFVSGSGKAYLAVHASPDESILLEAQAASAQPGSRGAS